ncbi:hypothetical protein TREMEDRAFT_56466 [Tremella mesenterica DSM 1558]|uniref:uncharacterized protein n=1 Tax=Tremella mesenterica (strain ATCC 24925 / CBS 8224 / DSM 1558 / NBRC 9311 / NRRL Y-6157 / RJB 2259-6 / UBC 559-6) TaxID=578456 RepID=UPI0003F4951B|nr:uncharacterized protein TREMEDRAFT_56466 [Tremella mesenterica DSM 1558]EIW71513.1 hypothetical protein TREMEDRAFT_56466 [Tremella mesenterica DSM 1558]
MTSPLAQRYITVTGPLGEQVVPILPPIILSPLSQTSFSSSSSPTPSSNSTSSTDDATQQKESNEQPTPTLSLTIHNRDSKQHRSLWGLTRSLIHNAVQGVTTGYTLELRLVGVGYRASVEPIPPVFLALQAQVPRIARPNKPGSPPYVLPPLPENRLNIKLGYAHPVLIDIPRDIEVETPQPTKIILRGTDKQKLGRFAAKIRRWRKPEPYRGKGIFVGDETIKLKEIKKK